MRKLEELLGASIEREEVLRCARAQAALRSWPQIVGELLAERSTPDRYDRGTVWVSVQGSAWAQELRMIKHRILNRLADIAGDKTLFLDLRFGVRPPRERKAPDPPAAPKRRARPDLEGLSIREIAERRLKNWPDASRD
ncbi:MAG TPA: DUF721 domain-containing protein [Fimbriimonadaceae bacterium]|nr:DUF721 domain-containing protein [Fimbriimonadaceae bacterium]